MEEGELIQRISEESGRARAGSVPERSVRRVSLRGRFSIQQRRLAQLATDWSRPAAGGRLDRRLPLVSWSAEDSKGGRVLATKRPLKIIVGKSAELEGVHDRESSTRHLEQGDRADKDLVAVTLSLEVLLSQFVQPSSLSTVWQLAANWPTPDDGEKVERASPS